MFKKKKALENPMPAVETVGDEVKKTRKKRQREKCENCKKCWGFCDFLKTSWKLFKEFSADTSIHGLVFINFLIIAVV